MPTQPECLDRLEPQPVQHTSSETTIAAADTTATPASMSNIQSTCSSRIADRHRASSLEETANLKSSVDAAAASQGTARSQACNADCRKAASRYSNADRNYDAEEQGVSADVGPSKDAGCTADREPQTVTLLRPEDTSPDHMLPYFVAWASLALPLTGLAVPQHLLNRSHSFKNSSVSE